MITDQLLRDTVYELALRAVTGVSPDVLGLLKKALSHETNSTAQSMMKSMLDNVALTQEKDKAVCQSPGYPTIYVTYGDGTMPCDVKPFFREAIKVATDKGYLRPSIVHPLTRQNSGDNSGDGVPNFELDYCPEQDYIEMIISAKGCGAELGNIMKVMTPASLGKDYEGFKRLVLETVVDAGGKPCPPVGIGIGIGGQMDVACKMSRRAISTRRWDDVNPDPLLRSLEDELLENINKLGLGAAGTGGDTYALAVKIMTAHTHTAIAPVAINFHCWVARRAGVRLYRDGHSEIIL